MNIRQDLPKFIGSYPHGPERNAILPHHSGIPLTRAWSNPGFCGTKSHIARPRPNTIETENDLGNGEILRSSL